MAFISSSSTLISGDTNTFRDVFVHDRDADEDGVFDEVNEPGAISTERVSVASDGTEANADSSAISISANGRYVAFLSAATNLVPNDTSRKDVFVRDLQAQTTEMVSLNDSGIKGNGASFFPSISADGRYVAFNSGATNLDADRPDTNNGGDVFVHERATSQQANDCGPPSDTTPPMVNSTSPLNNATGIASTANVSATFSEDMDRSTLTTSSFTLTKQNSTSPLAATVGYDSTTKTATLDPSSDLAANATYVATVKGDRAALASARDLAGNALAQDFSWSFTTAPPPTSCTMTGTANAETISGTSGDDVICAGGGNDTIKGLEGNDILKGEAGADKLFGGAGDDTLDGGTGTDAANFSGALAAITASLTAYTATGEGSDTLAGVENLVGSSKNDVLTGSEANNTINGGGGADTLDGLGGVDTLTGGGGVDTEHGGLGNDSVVGSGGADSLFGDENDDALNSKDGVNGNDSLDGGAGTDTKVTDAAEKSIVGFP